VRLPRAVIEKHIDIGKWWHGSVGQKLLDDFANKIYKPKDYLPDVRLLPIKLPHPKLVQEWVDVRRPFYERWDTEGAKFNE